MGSINTKERIMQHTHTGMQAGSLDGVAVVLEVVNALVELVLRQPLGEAVGRVVDVRDEAQHSLAGGDAPL